jgi:hypothetical protein
METLKRLTRRKDKKIPELPEAPKPVVTELETFCGADKKLYDALHNTILLDPRNVAASLKEAVEKAEQFEKQKDYINARVWYNIAGGLAIYERNVAGVTEYFGKVKEISETELSQPVGYTILNNPERAVEKAQEFYAKHLKEEQKK